MSDSLRNVLLQEMRDKFPKIDWRLGSVVRELVVEPLAGLGDEVDKYINAAKASLDILSICENPTKNEEAINEWVARLGIRTPEETASTGTIRLFRTSPDRLVIPAGTQFSWNGETSVYTTETYTVVKPGEDMQTENRIEYVSYQGFAFSADIPVVSYPESGTWLASGASINWSAAPADVYDIKVGSAISGGRSGFTVHEKAAQILDYLTPDALSGEACIRKALRRNFPEDILDVIVGEKDVKKPYAVNLYIKPKKYLEQFYISTPSNGGNIVLDGCGLVDVLDVVDSSGCSVSYSIDFSDDFGDTGSSATIKIESITNCTEFKVMVLGFSFYRELNSWCRGATNATPFEFNLKVPIVASVSILCSAENSSYSNVKSAIAGHISALPLDGLVTDQDINKVMQEYDASLSESVVYSVSAIINRKTSIKTTFGNVSSDVFRVDSPAPVAFYSADNLIEIKSA